MLRTITVIAASLVLAGSTFAQTAPAPTPGAADPPANEAAPPAAGTTGKPDVRLMPLREIEDEDRMIAPWHLSVDELQDMDVYGDGGELLGEVEEVLEDGNGRPAAIVVEYGGFLGLGGTRAMISLDRVQVANGRFVTKLRKDELNTLPAWSD